MSLRCMSGAEIGPGAGRWSSGAGRIATERRIAWSAITLALVLVAPALLRAQAKKDWIGERVVPKSREFTLRREDPFDVEGASAFTIAFTIYCVVKIDGTKLWLETEEKNLSRAGRYPNRS
jgi:hypothetical protein